VSSRDHYPSPVSRLASSKTRARAPRVSHGQTNRNRNRPAPKIAANGEAVVVPRRFPPPPQTGAWSVVTNGTHTVGTNTETSSERTPPASNHTSVVVATHPVVPDQLHTLLPVIACSNARSQRTRFLLHLRAKRVLDTNRFSFAVKLGCFPRSSAQRFGVPDLVRRVA